MPISQRSRQRPSGRRVVALGEKLDQCAHAGWLVPTARRAGQKTSFIRFVLRRPGGYVEVSEPDPIPNSVVKRLRADGTSS